MKITLTEDPTVIDALNIAFSYGIKQGAQKLYLK